MLAIIFIFAGALFRLLPHLPNFTPINGIAFFGGANLSTKKALLFPFGALALSDYFLLYINPYNSPMMDFSKFHPVWEMFHSTTPYVWGSFLLSVLIGRLLINRKKPLLIFSGSILCSVQFFLLTNLGVFMGGYYGYSANGLLETYIMGLPFFKWTILGDLVYSTSFFAAYALAKRIKVSGVIS